jgi:L-aspartate oxidase
MWKHAGLLRDAALLGSIPFEPLPFSTDRLHWSRRMHEACALDCVAHAIVESAHARQESRGAHYRSDFPSRDDLHYGGKHSILSARGLQFGVLEHEVVAAR